MRQSGLIHALSAGVAAVFVSLALLQTSLAAKTLDEWKAEYLRPTTIPFPDDNQYTSEKARLGQMLFFDPRLSGANNISCGSCHNPSFSWGDRLALGIGEGTAELGRRTPTILNGAWFEQLMWDGRFDSLEEQALGPMGSEAEMHQDLNEIVDELAAVQGYTSLFNVVFPGEGITIQNIAKAIATYERTIVSGVSPLDLWIAGDEGAISDSAKRGFDLFNGKANCVACHSTWNFTDGSFHDIGLPGEDRGRGANFENVEQLQFAFKTPTLRNAVERGPYMHDGSIPDLRAVVIHYDSGTIHRPSLSEDLVELNLQPAEVDDLVAFLETLSSDDDPVVLPVLP
jgi:cytochrome c peroxidase